MQQSILDEIRNVWIADETLSRLCDITSQSKQKLPVRGNLRRSKTVKIYPIKTEFPNFFHGSFSLLKLDELFNEFQNLAYPSSVAMGTSTGSSG